MATTASIFRTIVECRRSARRFQPNRAIPSDVMQHVLESALRAPSSFNLQPTQIILVQDSTVKERLSQHAMLGAGNQYRTKDASVVVFFLSDLEVTKRIDRIQRLEQGTRDPNYSNMFPIATSFLAGEGRAALAVKQMATQVLSDIGSTPMPTIEPVQAWTYKSTALLAQTYVLAATSHGLATCIMEGYDSRRVKEILRVPDRYDIPLAVATGYDYEEEDSSADFSKTRRLPLEEVCFQDSFGMPLTFDYSREVEENNPVLNRR